MKFKNIKIIFLFLLPILLYMLCSLITPNFGLNNLRVVVSQAVIPIAMGYGIAFASAAGIFDLSAGARVILSASAGGYLATAMGYGIVGLVVGSILIGIVMGAVMGFFHNLLRIPSLILSLGFVMLIEVIGARMLGSSSYITIDKSIVFFGKDPYKYIICAILGIAFYFIYYHTKFSSHIRFIGGNELLARNMGIKPKKINFGAFAIGGIFLGVVGILQISYGGAVASTLSMSSLALTFQPLMGVLIGMELLVILDNLAITIIIGELFISILYNMIIAMGVSSSMQDVLLGVFMITVMSVSANKVAIGNALSRLKKDKVVIQ